MRTGPASEDPFQRLIGHAHRVLSLKRLPDCAVMVSGGWRGRWNSDDARGDTVAAEVEGNWSEAITVIPDLARLQVIEARADRQETSSIDGVPIIDRIPGLSHALFACGWCGHGWAIAPVVAELLARWVADGVRPPLLAPFGYDRFTR